MKPALLAEEISGYFYHFTSACVCFGVDANTDLQAFPSVVELQRATIFLVKTVLFLSKSSKKQEGGIAFCFWLRKGKEQKMIKAEWKSSNDGKVLRVHYHHVRCETAVCSEMMSACKQEVALHVCVCVCALHMSTDGWVDQAVFAFTDLLWCVILFLFNIFYSLDYRYTGNAVVLEYKRWKTAIVCSPSVSPKVLWWYSRQTNISCLWSGKNLTNRLVKIKKGFQFLPDLLTISREGHGYDMWKKIRETKHLLS